MQTAMNEQRDVARAATLWVRNVDLWAVVLAMSIASLIVVLAAEAEAQPPTPPRQAAYGRCLTEAVVPVGRKTGPSGQSRATMGAKIGGYGEW